MTSFPSLIGSGRTICRGRLASSLVMPRPNANTRFFHLSPNSISPAITPLKPLPLPSLSISTIAPTKLQLKRLHTSPIMSDFEPAAPSAKPKITLHWLNQSRSQRIVWLLEELGLEYDIKTYLRSPAMLAPEEVKEIHPLGKLPIVVVDGKVLAESGLITEYLIDKFGPQLKPKDEDSLLLYKYYLHYAEGSLMPPMLVGIIVENINKAPVPFFVKPLIRMITGGVESRFLKPNYKTHFDFLESELASRPYLAGEEFSGADVLMSFQFVAAKFVAGLNKESYPKIWEYVERCEARDAFKRAAEKTEAVEASGVKL